MKGSQLSEEARFFAAPRMTCFVKLRFCISFQSTGGSNVAAIPYYQTGGGGGQHGGRGEEKGKGKRRV
jgi:hypothetical protein